MADRLSLTHAFQDGGVKREAAERFASEIFDPIHENVAAKADLREVEQGLERRINQIVIRLGALVVLVAGLLFAALQRWPPH